MGTSYGQEILGQVGRSIGVLADPTTAIWKIGGITFKWTSVGVAPDDVTLEDNVKIDAGEKFLRYGTVVRRDTDGEFVLALDTDTLIQGETFVVPFTVREQDAHSNHFGVVEGGGLFLARLLVGGAGQPTLAALKAACPLFTYAYN